MKSVLKRKLQGTCFLMSFVAIYLKMKGCEHWLLELVVSNWSADADQTESLHNKAAPLKRILSSVHGRESRYGVVLPVASDSKRSNVWATAPLLRDERKKTKQMGNTVAISLFVRETARRSTLLSARNHRSNKFNRWRKLPHNPSERSTRNTYSH